jgi:hypothetical protein
MAAYLTGVEAPTEEMLGLARSAAITAFRLERLEVRAVRDEAMDDERLVRLAGVFSRTIAALSTMKAKAFHQPINEGGPSPLALHLAKLARQADLEAEAAAKADGAEGSSQP